MVRHRSHVLRCCVHRILLVLCGALAAVPAVAQDRAFLYSVAVAPPESKPALRIDYDLGAGESLFQSSDASQPEQRVGVHATYGRLTVIGRVGLVSMGSAYQSAQSGEALVSLLPASMRRLTLAAGGGMLHEAGGTNVLLARIVGGRDTDAWRLHGNLLFQKPLSDQTRDAVDLITSVGWGWRFTPSVAVGVEGIGEDLEGFWDPNEAEGGARLLFGPSLHVAPDGRRWQFTATGGPVFHPADSGRSSGAIRDLPQATGRVGYAVRAGVTCSVF
jgi:hypothetical protein